MVTTCVGDPTHEQLLLNHKPLLANTNQRPSECHRKTNVLSNFAEHKDKHQPMNANVLKISTVLKLYTGHNGNKQKLLQLPRLPRGREAPNPPGARQTLKAPGE